MTEKNNDPASSTEASHDQQKKTEPPGVIEASEARCQEKKIDEGVLDTVQNLTGKKIRRRERIINMAWHRFLIFMLCLGGSATIGWIYARGYWNGQSSTSQVQTPPATSHSQLTPAPELGMTTATVKAALAETETILSAADRIAKQMRPSPVVEVEKKVESPKPEPPTKAPTFWDLNK